MSAVPAKSKVQVPGMSIAIQSRASKTKMSSERGRMRIFRKMINSQVVILKLV